MKTFYDYTAAIKSGKGYKNISRLEFLQPDGSVAFSIGSYKKPGYQKTHDTRAFLQDGSLNISLQNGMRRKATVKFANVDEAFSFNVNNIWFGKTVRLLMGIEFADGEEFMFSQGVFVIQNPEAVINPTENTITYNLSDKWVNLNGENGGSYDATYRVPIGTNIFTAMKSLLELSRYTFEYDGNKDNMFDSTEPVFTEYYNNKRYIDEQTSEYVNYVDTPYEVVTDSLNGTIADTLLELNTILAGWIGYNANGALTVEASQDDISDASKPTMWTFTPDNSVLCGLSESSKTADVKNDIIISSEDLNDREIWGRASNYDDRSDTNINLIGKRTYREAKSTYWSVEQCVALAQYELKKRSIVQKSITIECAPMFHLNENEVVAIVRTDKEGSPTERHLIQSITIPISETGSMQINATSVNDIPILKYSSSTKKGKPMLNEALYLALIAELRTEGGKAHTFQIPTITGTYTYTGSSQTPTITGYYGDFMTKTGNTSATNAGSYSITVSLTDTENCQWSDGTITDKVITWSIEKAALPTPTFSPAIIALSPDETTKTATVLRSGTGEITAISSDPSILSVSVSDNILTLTALDTSSDQDVTVNVYVAESANYYAYTANDATLQIEIYAMNYSRFDIQTTQADASISIRITRSGTGNLYIDWGDGSAKENYTTSNYKSHTYTNIGDYIITVKADDTVSYTFGYYIAQTALYNVFNIYNPQGEISYNFTCSNFYGYKLAAELPRHVFFGTYIQKLKLSRGVVTIAAASLNTYRAKEIDLPDTVTSIAASNFSDKLQKLTVRAVTPPSNDGFKYLSNPAPATLPIYVPANSVSAYQNATGWSDRAAYIQAIPS